MTQDPEAVEAQRARLRTLLAKLDSDAVADMLTQARLDVLSFVACVARVARRVLPIEQASLALVEDLSLQDPTPLEDARTVRASSIRALEQMNEALGLICDWLQHPLAKPEGAESDVRRVLHAFSNVLVGINCYAELLADEVQPGDACYPALATIRREGAAVSRLVRERAALQEQLNRLFQGESEQMPRQEAQLLRALAENLGVGAPQDAELDAQQLAQALAALPPAEGHVLREVARRLGAPSG